MGEGSALAVFTNSSLAFEGQKGTTLPSMPSQATWKRGMTADAGWTLRANHGGGCECVCTRACTAFHTCAANASFRAVFIDSLSLVGSAKR